MIDKPDLKAARLARDAPKSDKAIIEASLDGSILEQESKSVETALVQTLQRFLRDQGETYSEAAIRDLPANPSLAFSAAEMVSVLREIGHIASFGAISAKNLLPNHCPMIAFWEDGSAFILTDIKSDGSIRY